MEIVRGSVTVRMKPKLVIVGAQKAGTTTLFDVLAQHPRIIAPHLKEISFFSDDEAYAKGMEGYWSRFPRKSLLSGYRITFEASPMYLFHPLAAERIARHLPKALCLAVLRDPVERAYSAWNMYHQFRNKARHAYLYDPRTFEEAVADEMAGKKERRARMYLQRSLYAPQLERYLVHVGSDRLMVKGFGQLKRDAHGLLAEVLAYLSLDPFPKEHPALLARSNERTYPPVNSELKALLRRFFEQDVQRVEELVGPVEGLRGSV